MKPVSGKSVVVTGGSGFIGTNLVRRLLSLGYEVHVLLKKSSDLSRIKDLENKISLHNIDIFDQSSLNNLFKKIHPVAIFHLATYSSYRNQGDVEKIMDISIRGTLNLLLASKDIDYKVFVNTGSSSEYGFKDKPMKESDLLEPISFYASAKAGQTLLCQAFSYQYKKPIVTIRPFSVYGPYEQSDRFIPTIIKSLIEKEQINITSGEQRRDFIYIDDLIDLYIKALDKPELLSGKILNAGTGKEYANDEIVQTLFKVSGKKTKIEKGKYPKRMWDSAHWVADISLAKKILNWSPKFSIEKGLSRTYNWYTQNNDQI